VLIVRPISTFEYEKHILTPRGVVKLALPLKSRAVTMVDGQIVVHLSQDWDERSVHIRAGALASFAAATAAATPTPLAPVAVFVPGPRESFGSAGATRDRLMVTINQNVRGRVFVFSRATDGAWTRKQLAIPDNVTTYIADADRRGTQAFVSIAGFLTPSS